MKRKLLLLTITLLIFCTVLASCGGDKAINGINVTGGLSYTLEIGATPDFSKVTADITYNDGTSVSVTAADLTFSSIDTSTAGVKKLTITYKDYSITVDVTVKAAGATGAKPTAMQVISSSVAGSVLLGDTLDITGLKVLVTYDDGTTQTVEAKELTIGSIDTSVAGEQTLTVSYGSLSTSVTITVYDIVKIEVDGDSIDTTVEVGEEIDLTNLKVYAVYGNDARVLLDNEDLDITLPNTDTEGDDKLLVIAYGEHKVELPVSSVPPTLVSIKVNANSITPKIPIDGKYSTAGITATAYYSNNTTKQIATDVLTFSAVDTSVAGETTLTVTFEDKTDTVTITVLGVKSISIDTGSIKTKITVGDEYDTSALRVIVTYADDSTVTLTLADGVTVGEIDTDTVGSAQLIATYKGVEGSITVTVAAPTYEVDAVEMPTALSAFHTNKLNFKDSTAPYKVGDDNPFRFSLTLLVWDPIEDKPLPNVTDYVGMYTVYLVENGTETKLQGEALTAMVDIDEGERTLDFTEAAIGKTFRIETRPRYGVEESDAADVTRSITVLVVDAYNVYDAKELNLMTNYNSKTITDLGQSSKEQLELVNEFLANNNIARPEKLAGMVFHGDISLTMNDLPDGYLYAYTNKNGEQVKHFYDHFSIFSHVVDLNNPSFTLYGNYFALYTDNLPLVCENGYGDNSDDFSSTEMFNFDVADEDVYALGAGYDQSMFNTRVENLFMRGEDPNSNVESESEQHMRGLIAYKSRMHNVHYYNIRVEAYFIAIVLDGDYQTVTVENAILHNAWQNHIYLWGFNKLQNDFLNSASAAPIEGVYKPIVVNIKTSSLTKCGGPVIIADYQDLDEACNAKCGVEVYVDAASTLSSYVTGQEAWFVANGVSTLATQILALNQPISLTAQAYGMNAGITSTNNPGMNGVATINLIFVNRGPRGKIVVEGKGTMDQANEAVLTYQTATGGAAPIFQSAAGGIAYLNESYNLKQLPAENPDPSLFQGDYMNLFMDTPLFKLGVMMTYYHE